MPDQALPRRRGLAVAVQLAVTLGTGLYAPRLRAQQIACPAVAETVSTATAVNAVVLCTVTGTLDINSGGILDNNANLVNTGALTNRAGGTLNNNAAFIFNDPGGALANEGTLNNAGVVTNYSGSTLTNSGTLNNTSLLLNYSGAAVVNSGMLNNGVLGKIANYGALTNNGTLNNNGTSAGTAGLYNYSGATLTNNGILNSNWSLYNFGALVNSTGAMLNNNDFLYNAPGATLSNAGTLTNSSILFLNFGALTNSGTLNNTGALFNNAGGTLANSGMLINSGTLTNQAGAALTNSGTLVNSGDLFNSGALTNSGTLTVTSTGIISGSSSITQSAGTLRVDGTVSQPITINGGTLTGTGSIISPVVNGGTLLPGAAGTPGMLSISGTLVLNPSAVLAISVTPSQASRVVIGGTASLAGTVQVLAGAGTYPSTPYTILTAAGGVTGTFGGVTSTSAFLTGSLTYDPNTVFLTLTQTASFDSVALTPNQVAVSTLISNIQAGGGSADMQSVLATLSSLSATEARAAYDSMAGAGNAAAKSNLQFSAVNGFVRTLMNRLDGAGSGELTGALPVERVQLAAAGSHLSDAGRVYAQAAGRPGAAAVGGTERGGAWTLVYGNDGKTSGDANAAGYRQDGVGIAFGADTAIDGRWRAGGAVNIGTQRADLDAGGGNVKTDGVSVAAYARYADGPLKLDAIAGLGRNGNEGTRSISVGGLARSASSDYDSDQRFAHFEASWSIPKGSYRLEPVAALGYTRVDSPAYTETGADALNLMVGSDARESIKSYLGLRTVHKVGRTLELAARALWSHEFGDADSGLSSAQLAGAPGVGAFQTSGVDLSRDGALLGLGLSGEARKNLALFGDVAVEARTQQWNASFLFGARYTW